jgi:ABC-type ATPase involved in cell division
MSVSGDPRIKCNPLLLKAMTLRGVGSYLAGARLKLSPLTILCGANGSGKSTWFKTLNMLIKSHQEGKLPFHFDIEDWDAENIEHTNAFMHLRLDDDNFDAVAEENEFGPPWTVGLELEAITDFQLPNTALEEPSGKTGQDFLYSGLCTKGTQLQIRFAHPSHWTTDHSITKLYHLIELRIGNAAIRLTKLREISDPRSETQLTRQPYNVEGSLSLIPGYPDFNDTLTEVGRFYENDTRAVESLSESISTETAKNIVKQTIDRIHQVMNFLADSYFYVGAIRSVEKRSELAEYPDRSVSPGGSRYVGIEGQHTWNVERMFAYNLMQSLFPPFSGYFGQEYTIDECHPDYLWRFHGRARSHDASPSLKRLWEALGLPEGLVGEDFAIAYADALNRLLLDRELYDPKAWPAIPDELAILVEKGVQTLVSQDLARLNRLLIDELLATTARERPLGYLCEAFVSYWLERLTGASICLRNGRRECVSLADGWQAEGVSPAGYVVFTVPRVNASVQDGRAVAERVDDNEGSLARIRHPCFGDRESSLQPPKNLSAGFHQVAPMIVQAAVMRPMEMLVVENPEVHLHPSMQLGITEFFIEMAKSGRIVVLESHSDLVVRRVLRAILEEEIAQSLVSIYFVELRHALQSFYSSYLQRLEVNQRGQIANWPLGFMDDDVRESRRVIEAMYASDTDDWDE